MEITKQSVLHYITKIICSKVWHSLCSFLSPPRGSLSVPEGFLALYVAINTARLLILLPELHNRPGNNSSSQTKMI